MTRAARWLRRLSDTIAGGATAVLGLALLLEALEDAARDGEIFEWRCDRCCELVRMRGGDVVVHDCQGDEP